MSHLLIIGGSDAGISAALRAREVNPALDVTVVVADRFPNYSIGGLPFWLAGEVPDWRDLAHRTAVEIEGQGTRLLLEHKARAIDPLRRTVEVVAGAGRSLQIAYDKLVIGTGAGPARPPIEGLEQPGVIGRGRAERRGPQLYPTPQHPMGCGADGGPGLDGRAKESMMGVHSGPGTAATDCRVL